MDYDKVFEEMKKKYTLEEIAESMFFPGKEPTPEEHVEFVKLRMELREKTTPEQRIEGRIFALKYDIKECVELKKDTPFSHFIQKYLNITNKKQKDFADDLSINPSTLSRILNGKENIGKSLAYRLEKHSGKIIPAIYWWKLAQREIEQDILTNVIDREREAKMVKNAFSQEAKRKMIL